VDSINKTKKSLLSQSFRSNALIMECDPKIQGLSSATTSAEDGASAHPEQQDEQQEKEVEEDEEYEEEEEESQATYKSSRTMISRCTRLAFAIGCTTCLVILGIAFGVLASQGYFTFQDPCIGVYALTVTNVELGYNDDATSSSLLMGFLDTVTGGILPTEATITLDMIMEVNNTNPYDLFYEQNELGTIAVPASAMNLSTLLTGGGNNGGEDSMDIPPVSDGDLVIGTWEVPDSTLKKKSRNEIPVSITAAIDLMSADTSGLAGILVSEGDFLFRIQGGIEGSSWVPGLRGETTFLCLAKMEDIMDFKESASIKCRQSTRVGNVMTDEGDLDFRGVGEFFSEEEEVDPMCLV
jgi:hypothetical protein